MAVVPARIMLWPAAAVPRVAFSAAFSAICTPIFTKPAMISRTTFEAISPSVLMDSCPLMIASVISVEMVLNALEKIDCVCPAMSRAWLPKFCTAAVHPLIGLSMA
ncbi:hypothetical protein D3C78_1581710 [compost metagenome]